MLPRKRLLFVRHSQASALAENYDNVSEVGYRQARALGEHWAAQAFVPTRVYTGTLERHRQTLGELRTAVERTSGDWPDPSEIAGLNEHAGTALVSGLLPELAEEDPEIAAFLENPPEDRRQRIQTYFAFFRDITQRWAQGEFRSQGEEHWLDFRARVRGAVDQILEETAEGETAVVITSGGPVASTAGHALELSEQRTLELSWIVHNTAITEFFVRPGESFRMKAFNGTPHLPPELHTYV